MSLDDDLVLVQHRRVAEAKLLNDPKLAEIANRAMATVLLRRPGIDGKYFAEIFLEISTAMIEKDIEVFAKHIGASHEVYGYLEDMEFGSYKIYAVDVPSKDDPSQTKKYPVFEVEITKSTSDFFQISTNSITVIYKQTTIMAIYVCFFDKNIKFFKFLNHYFAESFF